MRTVLIFVMQFQPRVSMCDMDWVQQYPVKFKPIYGMDDNIHMRMNILLGIEENLR